MKKDSLRTRYVVLLIVVTNLKIKLFFCYDEIMFILDSIKIKNFRKRI